MYTPPYAYTIIEKRPTLDWLTPDYYGYDIKYVQFIITVWLANNMSIYQCFCYTIYKKRIQLAVRV